jgi:GNAT superfamily N-acetyltransferase
VIVTVRRIRPSDGTAIRALRMQSLATDAPAFSVTPDILTALSASEWDAFCTRNAVEPLQAVYVATIAEAIVGMAGLLTDRSAHLRHTATVWGIYVAPPQRTAGIASLLVRALIAHGGDAGFHQLKLTVTAYATAARGLYERCGFSAYAHEPDFLCVDGIMYDATHMRYVYPRK